MKLNKYEILSLIFSPTPAAFISTIMFSLFSPIGIGNVNPILSILIGTLLLTIAPVITVYYFEKDFNIESRKRRTKPYIITILGFLLCSLIFWQLGSKVMFMLSLSYFFVTLATGVINLSWKISAHASGMAGPTTALVYVFGPELLPAYIFTLAVIWIRLKAKAHSVAQLVAGTIISIMITLTIYTVLW